MQLVKYTLYCIDSLHIYVIFFKQIANVILV